LAFTTGPAAKTKPNSSPAATGTPPTVQFLPFGADGKLSSQLPLAANRTAYHPVAGGVQFVKLRVVLLQTAVAERIYPEPPRIDTSGSKRFVVRSDAVATGGTAEVWAEIFETLVATYIPAGLVVFRGTEVFKLMR